jgi:hypothetical protein
MKKLYFFLIFAMLTAGVFLLLKTVKPQPVGILKPSFFSNPTEIGAVVFRRFYSPLETQPVVVFGIPPQPVWHQDIILGFLRAAKAEGHPYDVVVAEPQMPPLDYSGLTTLNGSAIEVILMSFNQEVASEFGDKLAALRSEGKKVLVYTASVFSTHILRSNPLVRFEKNHNVRLFSFTSAPLAVKPAQEFLIDPPCLGSERDQSGTADFGCAILQSGRWNYRAYRALNDKFKSDHYVAIMNQQGPDDYLLMVAYPGQDRDAKEGAEAFRMNAPKAPFAPPPGDN